MPRDDDKSLGDEATLQGGKVQPAHERSLGDRSTFGGSNGSSLSDLGEFADLPDHDMEIVDLSSRYKLEKSLGKGGMGEVLLATDTRLDRKVAIKRIRGDAASSRTAVARFLTEAKSVAALNHHNIVQVHDYGRDEEGPFLIMEYVAGGTLLDRCKQGPIELEEAVELACQLCDGLGRAHDAGIVHRDIKPANILLTHDGVPKLTDFGLAKAESHDHTMTMAGAVLGTLDFMPPEQRQDVSLVDARSDLWSLAATLYQMVTGESPKVIRLKKVPALLQDLIDKALEEAKDDRYQTAVELKDAVRQALLGGTDAELDQGECPHCGTKNDASRKFCRNPDCGGSLEVPCLTCKTSIPMWEAVCGSCGAKQEPLVDRRRKEMSSQKDQAEAFVANHNYDQARRVLAKVEGVKDLRLQQLTGWVATFKDHLQTEEDRAVEIAGKQIHEAREHEVASDYPAAIKSLEQIPDSLRDRKLKNQSLAAGTFLGQLQRKQQEIQNLERQLRERVKAKRLTGLLIEVESLLRLVPNHSNALKLKEQLLARDKKLKGLRDKLYSEAVRNLEAQDYKATLTALSRIDITHVDSAVEELREQAETIVSTLASLNNQIKEKLAAKEYSELENLVDHFLILKAEDREKHCLKKQLVERNEYHTLAISMIEQQDYPRCLNALKKIDPLLVDQDIKSLRQQAKATNKRVVELDANIRNALNVRQFDGLLEVVEEYLLLQRDDSQRQQLRKELEARGKDQVASLILKAKHLRDQCNFNAALQILNSVPHGHLIGEAQKLSADCTSWQRERNIALSALKHESAQQSFSTGLQLASGYKVLLEQNPNMKDSDFSLLYNRCQVKLREKEQREEKASRRKRTGEQITVFGWIVVSLLILLTATVIGYVIFTLVLTLF